MRDLLYDADPIVRGEVAMTTNDLELLSICISDTEPLVRSFVVYNIYFTIQNSYFGKDFIINEYKDVINALLNDPEDLIRLSVKELILDNDALMTRFYVSYILMDYSIDGSKQFVYNINTPSGFSSKLVTNDPNHYLNYYIARKLYAARYAINFS